MSLVELFLLLVIAFVCGALGQAVAGSSRQGCVPTVVLGFVGAMLGHFIARELHLPVWFTVKVGGTYFPVVWAVAGSAVFVGFVSLVTRRS